MGAGVSSPTKRDAPQSNLSAADILEGALNHSTWLTENLSEAEEKTVITERNPGLQKIIEQKSSADFMDAADLNQRRPWNRGPSANTNKREVLQFTLNRRTGDGTVSPVPVTLDEIDQRTEARLKRRVSTAVFKDTLSNTLRNASKHRAAHVRETGEVNVVLLSPVEGVEDERAALKEILPALREFAAQRGVYFRYFDLSGRGGRMDFRSHYLPAVFNAIDKADIVFGVCGYWIGHPFPKASDQQEVSGFDRLKQVYPWVAAHKGKKTAFELAIMHTTLHRSSEHRVPTCYFFKDGVQSANLRDILEEEGQTACLASLKTVLGEQVPLYTFEEPAELVTVLQEYAISFMNPMLAKDGGPLDEWSREYEAQQAVLRQQARGFMVDRLDEVYTAMDELTRKSPILLVAGDEGVGSSSFAAKYFRDAVVPRAGTRAIMSCVNHCRRSSTLESILGQLILHLAPELCGSDQMTVGSMVNSLPEAMRRACTKHAAVSLLIASIDEVYPEEYYTGDFAEFSLKGSKLVSKTKCIVATASIYPGDLITRQNTIVVTKDALVGSVAPILYDYLVNGKGSAVNQIKAGSRIAKADVQHTSTPLSDAKVLEDGYGLVIETSTRAHSDATYVVVAAASAVAKEAGVKRGDILVETNGVRLGGKPIDEVLEFLTQSSELDLKVEVEASGRRHTRDFDWFPARLPANMRVIMTAVNPACTKILTAHHKAAVHHCEPLRGAAIVEKFVSARVTATRPDHVSRPSAVPALLTPKQHAIMCGGRCALTTDNAGAEMFVVTGCGTKGANGWYRKFDEITPINPHGGRMYIRRVPAQKPQRTKSRYTANTTEGQSEQVVTAFYIIKMPRGKGWALSSNVEPLYTQNQETIDPPPLDWNQHNKQVPEPAPKIVYIDKLAKTRAPSLVCRTLLDSLPLDQPIPPIFLVEGAGMTDVNGWYMLDAARSTSDHMIFVNNNAPSGKPYRIHCHNTMWLISEDIEGGKGRSIYRNAAHFSTAYPQVDGWSFIVHDTDHSATKKVSAGTDMLATAVVRSMSQPEPSAVTASVGDIAAMVAPPALMEEKGPVDVSAAGIPPKSPAVAVESTDHNDTKQLAKASVLKKAGQKVAKIANLRDAKSKVCPTARGLVPPVHLPLFLDLAAAEALSFWNSVDIDNVIADVSGNASIKNLLNYKLDMYERKLKDVFLPDAIRKILLLIFFSRSGMLEDELARLCGVKDGPWGLPWNCVFGMVRNLLVCYGGRWNFKHDAVKRCVEERYSTPMIRWAHASVQYSYFLGSQDAEDATFEGRYRADEELVGLERFDPDVFQATVKLAPKNVAELKIIGWTLTYNRTLTTLDLSKNSIGDRGARMVAEGLINNKVLISCLLTDNTIGVDGGIGLAEAMVVNKTLQRLDLRRNRVDIGGASAFADALKVNSSLLYLNLDGNEMMCSGAQDLADALEVNTSLSELCLSDNAIADGGANALGQGLSKNTSLTRLDLSRNLLGTTGTQKFVNALIDSPCRLQKLNMAENGADADSMAPFALLLRDNMYLIELNLGGNGIGDAGVRTLLTAMSGKEVLRANRKLKKLDLCRNGITDVGGNLLFHVIQLNGQLKDLGLLGNKINSDTQEKITSWVKINKKLAA